MGRASNNGGIPITTTPELEFSVHTSVGLSSLPLAIVEEVLMRRRDIIGGLLVVAAFGRAHEQPTATKIPRTGSPG